MCRKYRTIAQPRAKKRKKKTSARRNLINGTKIFSALGDHAQLLIALSCSYAQRIVKFRK